jgi:hypothetical protein
VNKVVAIALVLIMMASAFALVAPVGNKKTQAPESELPATAALVGPTEFEYTISNIGENYKKSIVYADHGRHTGGLGLSAWWGQEEWGTKTRLYRNYYYGDLVVRDKYPFIVGYNPYSDFVSSTSNQLGFTVHSFYRLSETGVNISGLGTGVGKDPGVLPILLPGGLSRDGGNPQMWLYGTYLSYQECQDIKAGTHYANTYYQVPAGVVDVEAGSAYYDGWWWELQGRIQFDRNASHKFLGLSLTASDLRTEFTTNNTGNALGNAWDAEWRAEGSTGGYANIYAAYDYTLDYGPSWLYLSLDPVAGNSNADSISVLMWSGSQGEEALFMRFLDLAGVRHNLMPYYEDYYLNMTLHPEYGDIQERMTTVYHMTAWKDQSIFSPSWMIEGQHADYTADSGIEPIDWVSYFDNYFWYYYDIIPEYKPTRLSYSPGQPTYNARVQYWQTPMDWNLTDGETLRIKLPTSLPGWGILPYVDASDVFNDAKVTQLNSNGVWGEWVLGRGTPDWYYSATYYDSATKTLSFEGPLDMPKVMNPTYDIFETGSPKILIDISRVSHYEMTLPAPPYNPGVPYQLTVRATNFTNQLVANWNGTVLLSVASGSASFGGTPSHTFVPGDAGVWITTVTFSDMLGCVLKATDQVYGLDVWDTKTIPPGDMIPEFPTLLIPVIGAAAIFVVLRRRKTSV